MAKESDAMSVWVSWEQMLFAKVEKSGFDIRASSFGFGGGDLFNRLIIWNLLFNSPMRREIVGTYNLRILALSGGLFV